MKKMISINVYRLIFLLSFLCGFALLPHSAFSMHEFNDYLQRKIIDNDGNFIQGSFKYHSGRITWYHKNKLIESYGLYKKGKKTGKWVEKYLVSAAQARTFRHMSSVKRQQRAGLIVVTQGASNNKWLHNSGFYEEGKRVGEWNWYYYSGELQRRALYRSGALDGTSTWYYPCNDQAKESVIGKIERQGNYQQGVLQGKWLWYDVNGIIKGVGNFNNGGGEWIWYHPDGKKIKQKETHFNGKLNGPWIWYHPDGKTIKVKGVYQSGNREGWWYWYYLDGSPQLRGYFKSGEKKGLWTSYRQADKKAFSKEF